MAKATAAETQKRIQEIIELQITGTSTGDIVHYAAQNWGIQSRAAKSLIAKATAELTSRFDAQRDQIAGLLCAQHLEVYRQALAAEQFSPAVGALKEIARLTGANVPEEVNNNVKVLRPMWGGWSSEQADD